jgi:AcrR family transcriptional regulator
MGLTKQERRESILVAAEHVLHEAGASGFNVREIASCADVAPATIYNYFESKEELLAVMLTARLDEISSAVTTPSGSNVASYLQLVMPHITTLFRDFEQGLEEWTRTDESVVAAPITTQLRGSFQRLVELITAHIADRAFAQGYQLRVDPVSTQFIWTVLIGMAQQEVNSLHQSFGTTPDELVRFAARAIVVGLSDKVLPA